jgi:hypothetical protein
MTRPQSPRSAKTKVTESAIDLTVLALGLSLLFEVLQSQGIQIPDGLEAKATAFAMALGGTFARWIRHRKVYG